MAPRRCAARWCLLAPDVEPRLSPTPCGMLPLRLAGERAAARATDRLGARIGDAIDRQVVVVVEVGIAEPRAELAVVVYPKRFLSVFPERTVHRMNHILCL